MLVALDIELYRCAVTTHIDADVSAHDERQIHIAMPGRETAE